MSPSNAAAHVRALQERLRELLEQNTALRDMPNTAAKLTTLMRASVEIAALEAAIECLRRECVQVAR